MNRGLMYGLIAAGAIVAATAVYWFARPTPSVIPDSSASPVIAITIKPTDIIRGNPNAPITMVEYASMTCHFCSQFQREVMPKLVANYIDTGKVRYIFREFPLEGAARMAAALARCETGDNYYSLIDLLFLNQSQWAHDFNSDGQLSQEEVVQGLGQMGRVAGLSQQQVESCINDPKNLAIVDANWQEAQTLYNVSGTPTFVLDGQIHRSVWEWGDLDSTLKAMLARRQAGSP